MVSFKFLFDKTPILLLIKFYSINFNQKFNSNFDDKSLFVIFCQNFPINNQNKTLENDIIFNYPNKLRSKYLKNI